VCRGERNVTAIQGHRMVACNAVRIIAALSWSCLTLGMPASTHAQHILIGQSIDVSGPSSEHGRAIQRGAKLVIEQFNAEGGLKGRKIELITLDDKGDAATAAVNAKKLIEEGKVLALFSGVEGGPCVAQTKVATESKVPVIACAAGSPDLREPFNPYSFPVRAAHVDEFARVIDTATSMGQTRFALLHSDSDTGRKHLANVRRLLKAKNLDLTLALPVTATFSIAEAVAALKAARVEVLTNHGSYKIMAEIHKATRTMTPPLALMAVNSGAQQMVHTIGPQARGIVFTQVVPFPWAGGLPIVGEYQQAWSLAYPKEEFSFSSLEGYINGKVLIDALKRAKSVSRAGIYEAMETMGERDLGGITVRYGPNDRTGSRLVDTVIANARGGFTN
jgi:branched-chain amino acid transport system substrate-binding protein